ncbi:PTS sugar transporter subunit IIA, partial [Acidobacteriota bacterium]
MMMEVPKASHFSDFLTPTQIVYELKAETKIQALEELLTVLEKKKLIKSKEPILTRVIDRERLDSTAIGHGVALPHARVNTGGDITVAVGRSKKGIDFDAVDNKKVHLIILVVWNPSIPGLFNHLFAGLAQFLSKNEFRKRLFNSANRAELHKILSEIVLQFPQEEDKIISRASLLYKLQKIEQQKKKSRKEKLKELKRQSALIREE